MKSIVYKFNLVIILSTVVIHNGFTQSSGNDWINFNNKYFKFKIHQDGIYRISHSQLNALGMGNVAGSQFAIFRDGAEVPIYVSKTGALSSNDFIEFYGEKANGKIDTEMYPNPNHQPNVKVNLLSDTASYFLTYDNNPHQRLTQINSIFPDPLPAPGAFCWVTATTPVSIYSNAGAGQSHDLNSTTSFYFYSSDYDLGEGWAYNAASLRSKSYSIATPFKYSGSGLNAYLEFSIGGFTKATTHNLRVNVANVRVFDTAYDKFQLIKRTVPIDLNLIGNTNTSVNFTDAANYYNFGVYIRYPRLYNFSGNMSNSAQFEVPASQRYLEIRNFNAQGSSPRLIDISNKKVYNGSVQSDGTSVRFYLDVSAGNRICYLSNISSVTPVTNINPVTFRDYSSSIHQGNYIILSHKDYINASPNYIEEYKSYRRSISGGAYTPVVIDVEELYDQFGYGYEMHPMSIRRFIKYALDNWSTKPEYLFIIGRGITWNRYQTYASNRTTYSFPVVPTWGHPGSDNLLSSFNNDQIPRLATGRLSAWNNDEIGDYLEKVKSYESAVKMTSNPSIENDYWKKQALHISGARLADQLLPSLNQAKLIIEDTFTGMNVTTIHKTSTDPVQDINDPKIDSLINSGVRYITFYGHASSSGFDYNLNSPNLYNAKPNYSIFLAYGCDVAHIFSLSQIKTISEDYIASKQGGSIAMVASNNYGYPSILPSYMYGLYRNAAFRDYEKSLGIQYRNNIEFLQNTNSTTYMDIHTQCQILQGDPGLLNHQPEKPDYVIEESGVSTDIANLSTSIDSFQIKVAAFNLGKVQHDSVTIRLTHTRPGNNNVLYSDSLKISFLLTDTLYFKIPIDPIRDVGMNNYTVKIDAAEQFDEISELNNQVSLQLFVYSDNLIPVYPKDFSIVYQQGIELKASTLNAFAPLRKYKIEIDTTELFTSSLKQSVEINSTGGVLKWKPAITFVDSTVYYWRAALDTLVNGAYQWTSSSFIYLANGSDGWNQSHYFQHKYNTLKGLNLQENNRKFSFAPFENSYLITNAFISPPELRYTDISHSLNDVLLDYYGCVFTGSIQVSVIDSVSGQVTEYPALCGERPKYVREFATRNITSRNAAKDFIESIPDGHYISIKNLIYEDRPNNVLWDQKKAVDWMEDTSQNGSGNSLYHTIKNLGFDLIDQFDARKTFIFFRRKGNDQYPVQQIISNGDEKIELLAQPFYSYPDTGTMNSVTIGPALDWKNLKWQQSALDNNPQNDSSYVSIYGLDHLSNEHLLYSGFAKDTSLSFISAESFPNLKLIWHSVDNINKSSAHLNFWRVLYDPVPEAALNAAAYYEFNDSLNQGQLAHIKVAIESLTPTPMRDSMLVSYKIIDANNLGHSIGEKRYKKLLGNDTLIASFEFDPSLHRGKNFLFIEANPNNDQPEQYHPNNLGYIPFLMVGDDKNPLLDVTFDGVHILDKDIISAKPFIKVMLKDESKHLALNDTSLITLQLAYPDDISNPVPIHFDGTICKFLPADLSQDKGKNEAYIEFKPILEKDGIYKLIVSGKDKAGNIAGGTPLYEIQFTVENKPSITNVLNYPNPFSTSTAFVFTLTGSEIPSQFKIQILSVTGKVVREITKNELGNLHIGRNITEYKWDGTDQYGQPLGNGVYLYRVITSIRGKDVDHRNNASIDQYFKNNYGKMYLMR